MTNMATGYLNTCPCCGTNDTTKVCSRQRGGERMFNVGCAQCYFVGPEAGDEQSAVARWAVRHQSPVGAKHQSCPFCATPAQIAERTRSGAGISAPPGRWQVYGVNCKCGAEAGWYRTESDAWAAWDKMSQRKP